MNRRIAILLCVLLNLIVVVPAFVRAQTGDTFEISQLVTGSGDVAPPTIPLNVTATGISTSQIDVSWTASTDNVAVVGYQVFRDGSFLATTTLTTYSDIGLTASTTYEYNITAFDAVFNISTTSATATAATLAEPVEVPDEGGVSGGRRTVIVSTDVVSEEASAVISWSTNIAARSRLLWGTTQDYELGVLGEVDAKTKHTAKLDGLTPGLRYYFQIVALNRFGNVSDTFTDLFVTTFAPDTTSPASPIGFVATAGENVIDLSWINPSDPDLETVRIIRSDKFFPDTPFAGKVIFDGIGTGVTDVEVVPDTTYYYAAFARDTSGNYAAPAVALARLGEDDVEEPFEEFPEAPEIPEGLKKLSLLDFDFIQDGKNISYLGTTIPTDGTKELTVAIDYDKLPEVLKTIGITLHDPIETSKTFSFLLRIDKEKTRYIATLAPLGHSGVYDLVATVLDLQNQRLRTFKGELVVPEQEITETRFLLGKTLLSWFIGLFVLLVLLLLLLLLFKQRRKVEEEIKETHA